MTALDQVQNHAWTPCVNDSRTVTRNLTNCERLFFNACRDAHGQFTTNFGAHISLHDVSFTPSTLHARAKTAFAQTRFKYPLVGSHLSHSEMSYTIPKEDEVKEWAERTVSLVVAKGGYEKLMERMSREHVIPTQEGDCWVIYVVVGEEGDAETEGFDILMRLHHTLADGYTDRNIFDELMARLADPLPHNTISWGKEVERLMPGLLDLAKDEEEDEPSHEAETAPSLHKRNGLPMFTTPIAPSPETRGIRILSHTFDSPSFLATLKRIGRTHGLTLTPLLHAAMLQVVSNFTPTKPGPEDLYVADSVMDLRRGCLREGWEEYTGCAISVQHLSIPCRLFNSTSASVGGMWDAAKSIAAQWQQIKGRRRLVQKTDAWALAILGGKKTKQTDKLQLKLESCPHFVSDPPGENELKGRYEVAGGGSMQIERYQLGSDTCLSVISARAHSWNGLLTLSLVFNEKRNPTVEMQRFLDMWVDGVGKAAVEASLAA